MTGESLCGRLRRALGLWALVAFSACVFGYDFLSGPNNPQQTFPFILKLLDPSLFPRDSYVRTAACFPSLYPQLMAWASRLAPLPRVHLILYLAIRYLLLEIVFSLTEHFFSDAPTSWLACFLFAFSPLANVISLLGDDPLMKTTLYQTALIGPLCLWSILLFLREEFTASFLILGSAYFLNGLIGNFVLILFFAASFRQPRSVLKGWLAFALPFAPWLFWYHRLPHYPGGASPRLVPLLKMWYPGHYFPLLWHWFKWERIAVFMGFFALFFSQGLRRCRSSETVKLFLVALGAMWAVAGIAGSIFPWPPLVLLQFFRSDVIFISLGLIFAADALARRFSAGSVRGICSSGLALLALVEIGPPQVVLPASLLFAFERRLHPWARRLFLAGWLTFCFVWLHRHATAPTKILLIGGLLAVSVMAGAHDRVQDRKRRRRVALAVVLLTLAPYASSMIYRVRWSRFSNASDAESAWEEMQGWISANTPKDAVFITPPYMSGFRTLSRRSPFVEWLDGAAMHWAPGYELEWAARLERLGLLDRDLNLLGEATLLRTEDSSFTWVRRRFESLTEEELERIDADYGAAYVVQETPGVLPFPVLYRNAGFVLYRIPR